jgi:hypothetical protein
MFFRLYAESPNMGRYVLDFMKDKFRVSALKTLTTAYDFLLFFHCLNFAP